MQHPVKTAKRLTVGALLALASIWAGCGSSTPTSNFQGDGGGVDGAGGRGPDGAKGSGQRDSGVMMLKGHDASKPPCVKPTCEELHADCGTVTDHKCGGVVECGGCKGTQSCGGGGVPNQCGDMVVHSDSGLGGDGCKRRTCADQKITCGVASDGCGGSLQCGSCNAPQTCGGDPHKFGQCGCTGLCSTVATCSGTTTTDLVGKVLDPAGVNPLYNVLVYVPNDPTDPGLQPFTAGVTCGACGGTAAGDPLVTTYTAPDGTFTLKGVPSGSAVPVVIQLGRWRRQFKVDISHSCGTNMPPGGTFKMPANHMEGDIPRIAIVTGAYDPVECALYDIGIDQSEFTNPGGGGYINFFTADDPTYPGTGRGAMIDSNTPDQDLLFAKPDGGAKALIYDYDMVVLECEGYQELEPMDQQATLASYLSAGGRVFASDYTYDWFWQNAPLSGAATWDGNHDGKAWQVTGSVTQPPGNPQGKAFDQWLENVGISAAGSENVSIFPAYQNVPTIIAPTQMWLFTTQSEGQDASQPPTTPIQFTFNTPLNAPPSKQCGRVTFNDWHAFVPPAGTAGYPNFLSGGTIFPAACLNPGGASSPQENIFEFMIFDLSDCVQPYTPICNPETCAEQHIECGPAGDGCGNLIQCGSCSGGQACGGGGAGKCGTETTTMCTPQTCAGQKIQCGPAGDGCGNELQCGNCATGQICGFSTPGQCGGMVGPAVRVGGDRL
jgi:hypothetical protein